MSNRRNVENRSGIQGDLSNEWLGAILINYKGLSRLTTQL